MSGKKTQKRKLVQRSEQRVQEDRMARQDDSCKRDGSGCFCIRGPGSDYRTCRFFRPVRSRFIN